MPGLNITSITYRAAAVAGGRKAAFAAEALRDEGELTTELIDRHLVQEAASRDIGNRAALGLDEADRLRHGHPVILAILPYGGVVADGGMHSQLIDRRYRADTAPLSQAGLDPRGVTGAGQWRLSPVRKSSDPG
jgi:hypothetical protein